MFHVFPLNQPSGLWIEPGRSLPFYFNTCLKTFNLPDMLRTEIRTAWYLGPSGTLAQETESSKSIKSRNAHVCFDVSRHDQVASVVGMLVGSSIGSEERQEFLTTVFADTGFRTNV